MNETIARQEPEQTEQPEPEVNWNKIKFEEWETPQAELEAEPEYQHLIKVCGELGLEI